MLNTCTFHGRLVADPEIKTYKGTDGDEKMAKFRIAVDRPKRKGEEKAKADFFSCVMFRGAAYAEQYLTKGSEVIVNGRLQMNQYEKEGVKRTDYDILVENVERCGGANAGATKPARTEEVEPMREIATDDDGMAGIY